MNKQFPLKYIKSIYYYTASVLKLIILNNRNKTIIISLRYLTNNLSLKNLILW